MGFTKGSSPKEVGVNVPQPWGGAGEYTFHLTRNPPKEAIDASESYYALTGEARADEKRKSLVRTVAAMMTREPEGFDDFPRGDAPLFERAVTYFDDPDEPDFEKILIAAFNWYLREGTPRAYLKSSLNSGAGGGESSGVPVEAPPVV